MANISDLLQDFTENLIPLTASRKDADVLMPGCHLAVDRTLYSHHGIYAGNGRVIAHLKDRGVIEYSMREFAEGGEIYVIEHGRDQIYSYPQALQRAREQIGQDGYLLLSRNCEHFATWCLTGKARSSQVEKLAAAGFTLTAIAAILRARSGKSPLPVVVAALAAAVLLSQEKVQDLLGEAGQKTIDMFNEAAAGAKSSLQSAADGIRDGFDDLSARLPDIDEVMAELRSRLAEVTDNLPETAAAAAWLRERLDGLADYMPDPAAVKEQVSSGMEEVYTQLRSFWEKLK